MAKGTINESIYKPVFNADGSGFEVNDSSYKWTDFNEAMNLRFKEHGVTQKLGDSYSSVASEIPDGLDDDEAADMRAQLCSDKVESVMTKLLNGDWTVRDVGPRLDGADKIAWDNSVRRIVKRITKLNKTRAKKDRFVVPTGQAMRDRVRELQEANPSIMAAAIAQHEAEIAEESEIDALIDPDFETESEVAAKPKKTRAKKKAA